MNEVLIYRKQSAIKRAAFFASLCNFLFQKEKVMEGKLLTETAGDNLTLRMKEKS